MGIDFRRGDYSRRVWMGKRTVKTGEACVIWSQNGELREVIGPCLVRLWFSQIRFLTPFVASSMEYLRINYNDGTVEHRRGPVKVWQNPVNHRAVSVHKPIDLRSESEKLVVCRAAGAKITGSSQIYAGPMLFFPEVGDVISKMAWTQSGCGVLHSDGQVICLDKTMARNLTCKIRGADGNFATVDILLRTKLLSIEEALKVSDPVSACEMLLDGAICRASSSLNLAECPSVILLLRDIVTNPAFIRQLDTTLRENSGCLLLSLEVVDVILSAELAEIKNSRETLEIAKITEQLADVRLEAAAARQKKQQALESAKQAHVLKLEEKRNLAASEQVGMESKRALHFIEELKKMNVDTSRYVCRLPPKAESGVAKEQNTRSLWW